MNAPATNAVIVAVPEVLETAVAKTGLLADGAASLRDAYAPHFINLQRLVEEASTVAAGQPKAARALRLEVRAVRVAADKARAALKSDIILRGRAIDGVYHVLEYQAAPIEAAMEQIEKAEEIAESNRKEALRQARAAELLPFADPTHLDLANMPEAQWSMILAGAKSTHEAKVAAEAKAEADRIAKAKADAEAKAKREAEEAAERERMRAENERLAKVAADERAAREASEAKAKAEREAADRILAAEREQTRKAREAAEAQARADRHEIERLAEIERAEAAHVAKLDREKREEAEGKLRRQNEAEAKRVADEQAAAAKAAAAPDKQKVAAFARAIRGLAVPKLDSATAAPLALRIADQVEKFAKWVESEAARL